MVMLLVSDIEGGKVRSRHERDFQCIGDLGDDERLGQEVKEFFPDGIREWGDKETEGNHLADEINLKHEEMKPRPPLLREA